MLQSKYFNAGTNFNEEREKQHFGLKAMAQYSMAIHYPLNVRFNVPPIVRDQDLHEKFLHQTL